MRALRSKEKFFKELYLHHAFAEAFTWVNSSLNFVQNKTHSCPLCMGNQVFFLYGFKKVHVHTNPDSNRICPSTRIRIRIQSMRHQARELSTREATAYFRSFSGCVEYLRRKDLIWVGNVMGFQMIRIQNFPLLRADSKSYGFAFRIRRIRVDGRRFRKEKVAD